MAVGAVLMAAGFLGGYTISAKYKIVKRQNHH
jgi:hypothetical protein